MLPHLEGQPDRGPKPSIVLVGNGQNESTLYVSAINKQTNSRSKRVWAPIWHLFQQHSDLTVSNGFRPFNHHPKTMQQIGMSEGNPFARVDGQPPIGENVFHVKTGPDSELTVHAVSSDNPAKDVIFLGYSRKTASIQKVPIASVTRVNGCWEFQGP